MPYKDPIKQKQWHDEWYQKNKEHVKARDKARRDADPELWNEKRRILTASWRAKNPEKARNAVKRYIKKNPTFFRPSHYKRKYGVTAEFIQSEIKSQENRCKVCREEFSKTPHVDHDHETGKYRAMLDFECNRGLGAFGDEPAKVFSALLYIVGHKNIPTIS